MAGCGAALGVQKSMKYIYFEPPKWFTVSHLFAQSPDDFDTWPWTVLLLFSVRKSCPTLCDPTACSTPGLPVLHYLLEFAQIVIIESVMLSNHLILSARFSYPQSIPASGSFPMRRLFASGGQSLGVSASVSALPINSQGWFPLGLTSLSKGLSRVFSSTTVRKHQFFHT